MILALLCIIGGVSFIGYGLYEKWTFDRKTEAALQDAMAMTSGNQEKEPSPSPEKGREWPTKPEDWDPAVGDVVGILQIPKFEAQLPIVEGTDPDELEKGVGHYRGASYPGELGQIVFSGHRDTVFLRLGELELGDKFVVSLPYGDYMYEIYETKIVDKDDTSIITLQKEKEELILTTCYPFTLTGRAPERYIVYAKPVL
jgi:sortase A